MVDEQERKIRVFISYVHEGVEGSVYQLSELLRHNGIDCTIDQYIGAPPNGWLKWSLEQIRESDYVLVLCNAAYMQRSDGSGTGGSWESSLIENEVFRSLSSQTKFIPVVFNPDDVQYIPEYLEQYQHYILSDSDSLTQLYRYLTGQPAVVPGPIGPEVVLPPAPPATIPMDRTGGSPPVRPSRVETRLDLSKLILGTWAVEVSAAQGIARLDVQIRKDWPGRPNFAMDIKYPIAQHAEGQWEVRPGGQLILNGTIMVPVPYPQVMPYSTYNIFDEIGDDELRGKTAMGEFVVWRRLGK